MNVVKEYLSDITSELDRLDIDYAAYINPLIKTSYNGTFFRTESKSNWEGPMSPEGELIKLRWHHLFYLYLIHWKNTVITRKEEEIELCGNNIGADVLVDGKRALLVQIGMTSDGKAYAINLLGEERPIDPPPLYTFQIGEYSAHRTDLNLLSFLQQAK